MRIFLGAFASLAAMFPAGLAAAQTPQPDIRITDRVEESAIIVVRGERRGRISAPVSGQSLIAEEIISARIDTLDALVHVAPGLHMVNDQDPGTNIVSLRGVSTDRLQQAAIAYVVDGVPLADTEFFTGKLFDVRRADVLRGPQGALFGKSAAGGAIAIETSMPGATSGLDAASLALGNGAARRSEAAGDLRLTKSLALRGALHWSAADGLIRNRTIQKLVDGEESRNLRLSLHGEIGPAALTARVAWSEEEAGAAYASSGNVTGRVGGVLAGAALTDPIGDFEGRSYRRWLRGSVKAAFPLLGGEFEALAARDGYAKRWSEELDYRPGLLTFFGAAIFPQGLQPIAQPTDISADTLDANWSRTLSGFDLRVGAFAQDVARARVDDFGPLLFGAPPPRYETKSALRAIFGSMRRDFGFANLEAQLRHDHEARRQTILVPSGVLETRQATFSQTQPRVAASLRVGEGVWAYGAYGEGFRSGGFNPLPGPASIWRAQFAPEVTRSGEIGLKGEWSLVGARLRAETSFFRSAVEDFQNYTFLDGQSVTLNVDRVDVEGAEAQLEWRDLDLAGGSASLTGGFALADARIVRFRAPNPIVPGAERDYSGARTPNAPLWTSSISASYEKAFGKAIFSSRLDVHSTGETVFEIDNALRSPGKTWLDGRLSLGRGAYTLSVFGRNLTDERWAVSAFGQGMLPLLAGLGPGGPFDTFTLNRPRQFGVELSWREQAKGQRP